jgi:hypothetical protein
MVAGPFDMDWQSLIESAKRIVANPPVLSSMHGKRTWEDRVSPGTESGSVAKGVKILYVPVDTSVTFEQQSDGGLSEGFPFYYDSLKVI